MTKSAYRAVASDASGNASFGGAQTSLIVGKRRVLKKGKTLTARLPAPQANIPITAQADLRGASDAAALYRRYHDDSILARTYSNHEDSTTLGEVMEQVRCESLGARQMDGVASNLCAALEAASAKKKYHTAHDTGSPIPIEDGLYALAFEQLSGQILDAASQAAANAWRAHVIQKLGVDAFDDLQNVLDNQSKFSELAAMFVRDLLSAEGRTKDDGAQSEEQDRMEESNAVNEGEESAADDGGSDDNQATAQNNGDTPADTSDADNQDDQNAQMGGVDDIMGDQIQNTDNDAQPLNEDKADIPVPSDPLSDRHKTYAVYTKDNDEVIDASKLATAKELSDLRVKLDGQLAPLQTLINKLANRLQRRLMARQQRNWRFDEEEGTINTARLARIIADPSITATYKREIETDFQDTVLTLLIDNSGSMRGRPITVAALTTDILAKILERCGVRVEILGFTTAAWKGGQSRVKWTEDGRPTKPGRLNDIRHIIYKGANTPLRRARNNISLMLKEGVLKENIDGEALYWAYQRLQKRPEKRKILMVISDGAPVDDSTLSANEAGFLEQDLHRVIAGIDYRNDIELTAVGIGHDVGKYYKNAITIRDVNDLPPVMMNELAQLFDK
jgi:cobaltochelatase CobT